MVGAELLILDLDGTLVDSFADIKSSIIAALEQIDAPSSEELLELCRLGVGLERFYDEAVGASHREPSERNRFEAFVSAYRADYFAGEPESRAYDGVAETLEELRRRRPEMHIGVATTKRTDMAATVVERTGLGAYIDSVRGSDGLPHKPNPALLLEVARAAEIGIEKAIMVGDTDRDVLAAKAAGCTAVAVTYGGWTRTELEALEPNHLIDRFAELLALV